MNEDEEKRREVPFITLDDDVPIKTEDDTDESYISPPDFVACEIQEEHQETPKVSKVAPKKQTLYKERKIKCSLCKEEVTLPMLQKHVSNVHNKAFSYECDHCDEQYETWDAFWEHYLSHKQGPQKPNKEEPQKANKEEEQAKNGRKSTSRRSKSEQAAKRRKITSSMDPTVCKVCQETFQSKQAMRRHILDNHKDIELFPCDRCDMILPDRAYLNVHKRKKHQVKVDVHPRTHYSGPRIKCPSCQSKYINLQSLKQHISATHANELDEKLKEILASDVLPDQPDEIIGDIAHEDQEKKAASVLNNVLNNKVLRQSQFQLCYLCQNVEFKERADFHEHMETVHGYLQICQICDKRFKAYSDIRNHYSRAHKRKLQYQCRSCDHWSGTPSQAEKHFREAHDVELAKEFLLEESHQQILVEEETKQPIEVLAEEKRCSATTVVSEEMVVATEPEKSDRDIPIPSCEQCQGKTFQTLEEYTEHSKTVHKRHLVCKECHKCYGTPQSLKKHRKKTHNFVLRYQCDTCQVIIKSEYHMQVHFQASHPGQSCSYSTLKESAEWKTGVCNICKKEFNDEHVLKNHIAIVHEKRKPYECSKCDRTFACRSSTIKHNLTYHEGSEEFTVYNKEPKGASKDKPLKCPVCQVGFTMAKQMTKHIKKFHPNQANDFLPLNIKAMECNDAPFSCQNCLLPFRSEKSLKAHFRRSNCTDVNDIVITFSCPACNVGFSKFKELFVHFDAEHSHLIELLVEKYPAKMKFACRECKKTSYKSQAELSAHQERFHPSPQQQHRAFNCLSCPRRFSRQDGLEKHIHLAHNGVKEVIHSSQQPRLEHCQDGIDILSSDDEHDDDIDPLEYVQSEVLLQDEL